MIPVNEPFIGDKEKEYVNECLDTGWISSGGRFINLFEEKYAAYCHRKFGIAVNNGTNALIAALRFTCWFRSYYSVLYNHFLCNGMYL